MSIPSELQPLKVQETWNICQSLHELILKDFITCYVDGDLSSLTKSGNPPAEKIAEKWQDFYSEYATKAGGAKMAALMKRVCTVQVIASKIARVETIVSALRLVDDARLYEPLRKDGFAAHAARLAASPSADEYDSILDDIEAQLKPQKMKLQTLSEQMPEDDGKRPSRDDFMDNLRQINEHFKIVLTDGISTYDYCGYIADMRRDVQARIKAAGKGSKHSDNGAE